MTDNDEAMKAQMEANASFVAAIEQRTVMFDYTCPLVDTERANAIAIAEIIEGAEQPCIQREPGNEADLAELRMHWNEVSRRRCILPIAGRVHHLSDFAPYVMDVGNDSKEP